MASSIDEEDSDLFLEEALSRIGSESEANVEIKLERTLRLYSKQRSKAFIAISNLKDSSSKRQELIAIIEEMSIIFFQLGVKCGVAKDMVADRLDNLETKIDDMFKKPSYADSVKIDRHQKVQMSSGKTYVPSPRKAIIIKPINDEGGKKTCDDTKKVLLSKIKPTDLGIKPDRLLKSGKSGIKIEAKEVNLDMINKEALKKAGLKMEIMGKWQPRMAVYGVPSDVQAETIQEEIMSAAGTNDEEAVVIKSKFGPRDKHYNHWVVEVSPGVRKELITRERIYIGWSACSVKDHVRVLRCYKCQKFGHLQKDCKGEIACGHCAGEHDTRKCRQLNELPKCYNCSKAGLRDYEHQARSVKCHMFIKRSKDIISNTEYDI